MTELTVLRVFLGPDGRGGNPLGVFLDGGEFSREERLPMARELGFSETVFVDEVAGDRARIAIYTPAVEMAFAGHPSVGTAWLLRERETPVAALEVPAGTVQTWNDPDAGLTWIRARAEWAHLIPAKQYGSPAEIDALTSAATDEHGAYVWAWIDESAGTIRSRFFANEFGIAEDEATGLAAVYMGGLLGRPLTIRQGVGSELYVRPDRSAGTVDVGGRVALVETRELGRTSA
jgi:predicted PhzF superfamily epimerase YddE/YHI9